MDFQSLKKDEPRKYKAILAYIGEANETGHPSALLVFPDRTSVHLWYDSWWRGDYFGKIIVEVEWENEE